MNITKCFLFLISSFCTSTISGQKSSVVLSYGLFRVDGDIDSRFRDGKSIGLDYGYKLHKNLSVEASYFYGVARGVDKYLSQYPYLNIWNELDEKWFPNYKIAMNGFYLGLEYQKFMFRTFKFQISYSIGLETNKTMHNRFDANGAPYRNLDLLSSSEIVELSRYIYDGSYETTAVSNDGLFSIDNAVFNLSHKVSASMVKFASENISIGLRWDVITSGNDYLDGIKYRTPVDETNNADIVHRSNIVLEYHF